METVEFKSPGWKKKFRVHVGQEGWYTLSLAQVDIHSYDIHILAVATDALVRPWPGVRKWPQYVWDMVEQGRCGWKDQGFINDARVRISYTSGLATANASAPVKQKHQEMHEPLLVVCRDYIVSTGYVNFHNPVRDYEHDSIIDFDFSFTDSVSTPFYSAADDLRPQRDGAATSPSQHSRTLVDPLRHLNTEKGHRHLHNSTSTDMVPDSKSVSRSVLNHIQSDAHSCINTDSGHSTRMCINDIVPDVEPLDFDEIRRVCESDIVDESKVFAPEMFQCHRRGEWPDINGTGMGTDLSDIYNAVKKTGLPNAMAARRPLPTRLNLLAWKENLCDSRDDQELLDFLTYGFPLGYLGPVSANDDVKNHPSATSYSDNIDAFLQKELDLGGIIGPMSDSVFK